MDRLEIPLRAIRSQGKTDGEKTARNTSAPLAGHGRGLQQTAVGRRAKSPVRQDNNYNFRQKNGLMRPDGSKVIFFVGVGASIAIAVFSLVFALG